VHKNDVGVDVWMSTQDRIGYSRTAQSTDPLSTMGFHCSGKKASGKGMHGEEYVDQ
jgi:hypothetical protein